MAPIAAPAATQAASSARSLPPAGTECRNMTAAAPTASTGVARDRASSGCSRIWRMTRRMRLALIRYVVMLLMPVSVLSARLSVASAHGWESGLIPGSTPGLTWGCEHRTGPAAAVSGLSIIERFPCTRMTGNHPRGPFSGVLRPDPQYGCLRSRKAGSAIRSPVPSPASGAGYRSPVLPPWAGLPGGPGP